MLVPRRYIVELSMSHFRSELLVAVCILTLGLASGCERSLAGASAVNTSTARAIREKIESTGAKAGSGNVAAAEPTGFATISGSFRVDGSVPAAAALKVDKDLEVCAAGGAPLADESVVVGADGGLANVLIYLATPIPVDDMKWVHESYAASRDAIIEFDQKRCVFLTHVFAARSTNKIKVLNSDPVGHNTNIGANGKTRPDNFSVPGLGQAMYSPEGASRSPFSATCSIHPWMKAYMFFSDNPYFAVSGRDGKFRISQVPAGVPLEFRVWHEKLGPVQEVVLNGSPEKWSKGKLVRTLQPGADLDLNVVLSASQLAK